VERAKQAVTALSLLNSVSGPALAVCIPRETDASMLQTPAAVPDRLAPQLVAATLALAPRGSAVMRVPPVATQATLALAALAGSAFEAVSLAQPACSSCTHAPGAWLIAQRRRALSPAESSALAKSAGLCASGWLRGCGPPPQKLLECYEAACVWAAERAEALAAQLRQDRSADGFGERWAVFIGMQHLADAAAASPRAAVRIAATSQPHCSLIAAILQPPVLSAALHRPRHTPRTCRPG
jgi:hypothetical protein